MFACSGTFDKLKFIGHYKAARLVKTKQQQERRE
jgi:hypothetical protein